MQSILRPVRADDLMSIELRDTIGRIWRASCLLILRGRDITSEHFGGRSLKQAALRLVPEQQLTNLLWHKSVDLTCLPRLHPALAWT